MSVIKGGTKAREGSGTKEIRMSWLEACLLVFVMFWIGVLNHLISAVTMLITVGTIVVPVIILYPKWEGTSFLIEHWVTVSMIISVLGVFTSRISKESLQVDPLRLSLHQLKDCR